MRLIAVLVLVLALSRGLENARGDGGGDEGVKPLVGGTPYTPSDDQLQKPTAETPKGPVKGRLRLEEGSKGPSRRAEMLLGKVVHSAKDRLLPNQNQTAVDIICGNAKCDHHEVCIYKQELEKHVCDRVKPSRGSRRHGHIALGHGHIHGRPLDHHHGQGSIFHASAKLSKRLNDTELDRHRRIQKLKIHAKEFQDQHDRQFKIASATDKLMKLRTKKFIDGDTVENNTSNKLNKECRQRDMDGVGRRLLDQFKMNQDKDLDRRKVKNKRRKEKRNSTKKELHDDDECICQAPVSWQFQQLDADADGCLSQPELGNVTSQGFCFSQFVVSCDHDRDGNLSEKEWCCCFADILPPCLALMKTVPTLLVRGAPMILPGTFVPECDDEGFFSQVQCHSGVCWCVDRNGIRSNDYATTTGSPDCISGQQASSPPVTQI